MNLLLLSLGALLSSSLLSLALAKFPRWASTSGVAGTFVASALGLVPALRALLTGAEESLHVPWDVPYGSFSLRVDALSALFLVLIFILSSAASLYAAEYLHAFRERKSLGPPWFFFQLLVAGMVMVVISRNGVLFLVSWEIMSLASFFLVTFEHEEEKVRQAGLTYLVAAHLGAAFLLCLFVLLGREGGSLDFDKLPGPEAWPQGAANVLFILAVLGFGAKAGFVPLHVWLPEAHPAAPSHVSALLSGAMIKTGVYGLLRVLTFLGPPPFWWGCLLCGIGLSSGVLGIVFALAQRDLKRLLAYSSVENIGIITMGVGVGLLGLTFHAHPVAVLGFAGGLFHVLNHSLFKGLLFLSAGSVGRGARSLDMEELGGLLKRMPWTGGLFLLGAASIVALPPLNGFSSELLIYLAALHGQASLGTQASIPMLLVILGLALVGGLAIASFSKALGAVFLGEPRSEHAATARETGPFLRTAMLLLASGCLALGLLSPRVVEGLGLAVSSATRLSMENVRPSLLMAAGSLSFAMMVSMGFLALVSAFAMARFFLLGGRKVERAVTWDCGYAVPSARMQYTASSFVEPLTALFRSFLRSRESISSPEGPFPKRASFLSETPDACREGIFSPLFTGIGRALTSIRWLQHGRVQLYVLYIAFTLLFLLAWKLH